jgi:hypothetical protein
VEFSHALMYDAIHERINDLVKVLPKKRHQNEHKFRVGNCVRVQGYQFREWDIVGELKMMRTDMWYGLP